MPSSALDAQIEDYAGEERFLSMVLGLMSFSRRVEALADYPRSDGRVAAADPILFFLLGIISAGRTLEATVACHVDGSKVAGSPDGAVPVLADPRIMR